MKRHVKDTKDLPPKKKKKNYERTDWIGRGWVRGRQRFCGECGVGVWVGDGCEGERAGWAEVDLFGETDVVNGCGCGLKWKCWRRVVHGCGSAFNIDTRFWGATNWPWSGCLGDLVSVPFQLSRLNGSLTNWLIWPLTNWLIDLYMAFCPIDGYIE